MGCYPHTLTESPAAPHVVVVVKGHVPFFPASHPITLPFFTILLLTLKGQRPLASSLRRLRKGQRQ